MMTEITTPIVSGNVILTSGFGQRTNPVTRRLEHHPGIDLAPRPRGNPAILSFDDGEVILIQWNNPSAGNWVEILHDNGYVTTYMHLDSITVFRIGSRVRKGQQIGKMGTTGQSTGIHLHFEIRIARERNGGRNALDPMPFLSEVEEMRFKTVQEIREAEGNLVADTIQNMLDRGVFSGRGGDAGLDVDSDFVRILAINDRNTRDLLARNGLNIQ